MPSLFHFWGKKPESYGDGIVPPHDGAMTSVFDDPLVWEPEEPQPNKYVLVHQWTEFGTRKIIVCMQPGGAKAHLYHSVTEMPYSILREYMILSQLGQNVFSFKDIVGDDDNDGPQKKFYDQGPLTIREIAAVRTQLQKVISDGFGAHVRRG